MTKLRSLAHILADSIRAPIEFLVTWMPGSLGFALRYAYYKKRLKYIGRDVTIDVGVQIINPEWISIGERTWIDKYVVLLAGPPDLSDGRTYIHKHNSSHRGKLGELIIGKECHIAIGCVIQAHGGVSIGDRSGVASGSLIYSLSHHYRNPGSVENIIYKFTPRAPRKEQSLIIGPVVMESNTCLGLNSVVLPGVTIGRNSWVGCCSFVVNNIPHNSIALGSPAKVIKKRFK